MHRAAAIDAPSAPTSAAPTASGHSTPEELRAHLVKKGRARGFICLARTVALLCDKVAMDGHAQMRLSLLIIVYIVQGGSGNGWMASRRGRRRESSQQL